MCVSYSETRLFKFACHAHSLARRVVPAYSSKFSKRLYTQPQHLTVLCVKTRLGKSYEEMEELLTLMPPLCEAFGLGQVPDHSTMCKAFHRLQPAFFLFLLLLTGGLLPSSGRAAVDATGFDRRHSSKHYVRRCKITLKSMKVTFLVDTTTLLILGVHSTVTRRHDTKIVLPLVEKTLHNFPINVLAGDKGYDDQHVRDTLRSKRIRPLLKHRIFNPLDKAHNARMNPEDYHQRSKIETVNSMIKRRYTDTLTSKTYWRQVRETILIAAVHNIDRTINTLFYLYTRISIKLIR